MRIGITGYATAGKDEVADVLVAEFGFVKIGMSDALDRYLQILNPIVMVSPSAAVTRYAELRGVLDYVACKRVDEVRRLLQRLGTDVGRAIDPNLWVNELSKAAALHDNVVTTGIRFAEEVAPLDDLIHVDRPGVGPLNDHPSESLDHIFAMASHVIVNDGALNDLRDAARAYMLGAQP